MPHSPSRATNSDRPTRLATGIRVLLALPAALVGLAVIAAIGGSANVKAATVPADHSLQVLAEPEAGITPFVQMVDGARKSIELTDYELTDQVVEKALAAAARRGVDVQVLLNAKDPFESTSPNVAAYRYLVNNGVKVRWAPKYLSLTHQKTLTVDGRDSAIMTLNFDGEYSSTRDFAILDRQPADVSAITATFGADWAGQKITPSKGTGDLLWSPGAGDTVLEAIENAKSSIDIENEEMDYDTATDRLCAAAKRGVDVKIVMTYDSEWADAFTTLEKCGVSVDVYHGQAYYIHAKILIVDGKEAIVGSQNLSAESLYYNRELSIDTTDRSIITTLTSAFDHDLNGATTDCSYTPPLPSGAVPSPCQARLTP